MNQRTFKYHRFPALLFCCGLALLSIVQASAQTYIFQRDSAGFTPRKPLWGRNYANMVMPYLYVGFGIGPQQTGAVTIPGESLNLRIGADYKRKITGWFSVGAKLQYSNETFGVAQETGKMTPDTVLNGREWFNLQNFVAGAFVRFNMDTKRGNHYGYFIELGANHVLMAAVFHSRINDLPSGEEQHIKLSGMDYFHPNYAEAYLEAGWKNYSLVASWRLTPVFKQSSGYPDLPTVKLGIELTY